MFWDEGSEFHNWGARYNVDHSFDVRDGEKEARTSRLMSKARQFADEHNSEACFGLKFENVLEIIGSYCCLQ